MEEGIKRERQRRIVSFIKMLMLLKKTGMCLRADTWFWREFLYKGNYQILYFNTPACFLTTSDKGRHLSTLFPSMVWLLKIFMKNSQPIIPVGGCNAQLPHQTLVSVITRRWLPKGSPSSLWTGKKEWGKSMLYNLLFWPETQRSMVSGSQPWHYLQIGTDLYILF